LSGHGLPVEPSIDDAKVAEFITTSPDTALLVNMCLNPSPYLTKTNKALMDAPIIDSDTPKPRADLCDIIKAWAAMTERSRHALVLTAKALTVKP
jgi:hypothetical protein